MTKAHTLTREAVAHIKVTDLYCPCCADELEAALRANPHIVSAGVDYAADEVEVRYHDEALDEAAIDGFMHIDALDAATGLTRIEEGAIDQVLDRIVEIGI